MDSIKDPSILMNISHLYYLLWLTKEYYNHCLSLRGHPISTIINGKETTRYQADLEKFYIPSVSIFASSAEIYLKDITNRINILEKNVPKETN